MMLYLASQSPRRQAILNDLGVRFDLLLPDQTEDAEALEIQLPNESAQAYVARVTLNKIEAARVRLKKRQLTFSPILCADTTVALTQSHRQEILGKPTSHGDAVAMLTKLSNRSHQVYTAVALIRSMDDQPEIIVSTTQVFFSELSAQTIQAYVKTGEPMGKAGAYGIQGAGSCLIERIEGSYSGVMGLPIFETCQLLKKASIPYILSV